MKKPDIGIQKETLEDLLRGATGNPLADAEIPEMLRRAIRAGLGVSLVDERGNRTHTLSLTEDGRFKIDA